VNRVRTATPFNHAAETLPPVGEWHQATSSFHGRQSFLIRLFRLSIMSLLPFRFHDPDWPHGIPQPSRLPRRLERTGQLRRIDAEIDRTWRWPRSSGGCTAKGRPVLFTRSRAAAFRWRATVRHH